MGTKPFDDFLASMKGIAENAVGTTEAEAKEFALWLDTEITPLAAASIGDSAAINAIEYLVRNKVRSSNLAVLKTAESAWVSALSGGLKLVSSLLVAV